MLEKVVLQQFRSYSEASFSLSPTVTVIAGPNGSGKTNILEALYVAARGSSFRASDSELLQFHQPWWRIDVQELETVRTVTFDSTKSTGRKVFTLNNVKKQRLAPQQKLPVVLFEPNDLRLLDGSPARRRTFIDTFITHLDLTYSVQLSRYDRALRQRNNLLKADHVTPDELFVWDMTLSELGGRIIEKRFHYTALLDSLMTQVYRSISGTMDEIHVAYQTTNSVGGSYQQQFLAELHRHHKRDIVLGYTTVGPHRDDVRFVMNGTDAMSVASRGETRSIVLGLKLIEIEQLLQTQEQTPLLLLDDVFSELDSARREALMSTSSRVQTIITTTDADIVKPSLRVSDYKLISTV